MSMMVGLTACLAACAACDEPATPPAPSAASAEQGLAPVEIDRDRSTTSFETAMANIDEVIRHSEKLAAADPKAVQPRLQLLSGTLIRFGVLGRLSDLEQARDAAAELETLAPENAGALLARAQFAAAAHRFGDSLGLLDQAEAAGASSVELEQHRATALMALGQLDVACSMLTDQRRAFENVSTLALEASCLGALGRWLEADVLFEDAEQRYRDVSPFVLGWVWFERARMWERAGDETKARYLYEAVVERLPAHAHAVSHYANFLLPADAAILLQSAMASSDDPDLAAELADVRDQAHDGSGKVLRAKAREAYELRLQQFPEAFADHAAWFFLHQGEFARAADLASYNLRLRATADAYELLLATHRRAERFVALCAALPGAKLVSGTTPALLRELAVAAPLCKDR